MYDFDLFLLILIKPSSLLPPTSSAFLKKTRSSRYCAVSVLLPSPPRPDPCLHVHGRVLTCPIDIESIPSSFLPFCSCDLLLHSLESLCFTLRISRHFRVSIVVHRPSSIVHCPLQGICPRGFHPTISIFSTTQRHAPFIYIDPEFPPS